MTNQKQSSKRQTIVIAILAVLLVGLLAFNVTYAFFTDKQTNKDDFSFGTIELDASNISGADKIVKVTMESGRTVAMPGDKIEGAFGIKLASTSEDAFVRYSLDAKVDKDAIFGADAEKWTVPANVESAKPVVAYINGNLVQARVGVSASPATSDVTIVSGTDDDATKNAVLAYTAFTTFTVGDEDYVITFGDNTTSITASVTVDGVAISGDDAQAKIDAAIKLGAQLAQRDAAIDSAIDAINEALDGGAAATAATATVPTGFIFAGDGYAYKTAVITAEAGVDTVEIEYTLPIKKIGNALQGVTISFDLTIEAVQSANNSTLVEGDYNTVTGWSNLTTAAQGEAAVKTFYAALGAHSSIEARN